MYVIYQYMYNHIIVNGTWPYTGSAYYKSVTVPWVHQCLVPRGSALPISATISPRRRLHS